MPSAKVPENTHPFSSLNASWCQYPSKCLFRQYREFHLFNQGCETSTAHISLGRFRRRQDDRRYFKTRHERSEARNHECRLVVGSAVSPAGNQTLLRDSCARSQKASCDEVECDRGRRKDPESKHSDYCPATDGLIGARKALASHEALANLQCSSQQIPKETRRQNQDQDDRYLKGNDHSIELRCMRSLRVVYFVLAMRQILRLRTAPTAMHPSATPCCK